MVNWTGENSHRRRMLVAQDWKCCYCGQEVVVTTDSKVRNRATVEHLTDRSKGGSKEIHNKAIACVDCNQEKSQLNMNWLEFCTFKKEYNGKVKRRNDGQSLKGGNRSPSPANHGKDILCATSPRSHETRC